MAVTEFLEAVDKKKKAEQAAAAAAPVSAEVAPVAATPSVFGTAAPVAPASDTIGQVEVQSPFSQASAPNQMAAVVDPMAQPDALAAAPAVQAPLTADSFGPVSFPGLKENAMKTRASMVEQLPMTADSLGPVSFPGLQEQSMDSRLELANQDQAQMDQTANILTDGMVQKAREGSTVGGFVENAAKKGFDYLFGAPTAEQAQNTLDTQPTDPAQRSRLQATAAGEGAPSDLSQAATYLFGRPENAGDPNILGPQTPPVVEAETPVPVADLSVNGTDVATPEAITEAGQVAPEAVAPQTPTAGSGGMITRDSTGESFIGGSQVAATPEEVAAYNATSSERMAAANTDAAAAERMRYNAPTIAEATGAGQTPTPRAPVRQSTKERDRSEKQRAQTLRKEGQRSIEDQMREFNREPHSMKERAAEKARLQGELNASIKEDRDYNRATTEANFANETAAYNRNTLTAAQRATDDGVSIRDQIALREEARSVGAKQLEETQSYNNASAAARSLVRDVGNIEDVAGTAKVQADSALTTGPGGLVMSILPGSKASDLRASLDTLTADSAFSALSEMRASSKTGGALGAISERELTLLGAAKRSLSANQSDEQLIKNIDTYVKIRNRMMADAKLRFAQDYGVERANEAFGGGQGGASSAIPNDRNVSGDSATEANIAKYNV